MVQHLCITLIVPPLLLISFPAEWYRQLFKIKILHTVLRFLVFPPVAFFIFNGTIFIWHIPALYDLALADERVHIVEHASFFIAGLLFWYPMYTTSSENKLIWWGKILYIFFAGMPMTILGAGLTFFPPLYTPYISAPRIFALSPLVDQQLGGLIMWIPVNLVYIALAGFWFLQWMLEQEQVQAEQDSISIEPVKTVTVHVN
jgi:putative membrane protein